MNTVGSSGVLVVDLCGTIVHENTTHGFLRAAPLTWFGRQRVAVLLSRVGAAATRFAPASWHRTALIASVRDLPLVALQGAAEAYAAAALRDNPRPGVLERIAAARAAGARVLLASASLDVVVRSFASRLGADGFVASRLAYRDGVATGRLADDCTGRKYEALRRAGLLGDEPFDVITDNEEDVDLLSVAAHPTFLGPEVRHA